MRDRASWAVANVSMVEIELLLFRLWMIGRCCSSLLVAVGPRVVSTESSEVKLSLLALLAILIVPMALCKKKCS